MVIETVSSQTGREWRAYRISLAPKKLGEIQRDGYRIEKLIFQTRPGVWMTANAYVPDKAKTEKVPAILHGHWAGAKLDRVVQSRCIGSVNPGIFTLGVMRQSSMGYSSRFHADQRRPRPNHELPETGRVGSESCRSSEGAGTMTGGV